MSAGPEGGLPGADTNAKRGRDNMKTATPESVGVDSRRLEGINRAMQAFVDKGQLSGAVAMVARQGEVVYAECFGWMNINDKKPM